MAYEHRPGSFSLFKNDKKGNDKAPDYSGIGMDMDGQMIRVAAWLKEGASGKFMSCKIEPQQKKEDAPKPATKPAAQTTGFDDMDDDIPF
jgi:hypothetical protein